MICKRVLLLAVLTLLGLILLALAAGTVGYSHVEPVLYVAEPNQGGTNLRIADANRVAGKANLVVVTHGWFEIEPWPKDMVLAIAGRVDPNMWVCAWYDWRRKARRLNPVKAAKIARDEMGPQLGREIVRLSKEWKHVHLIGHSAGAWLIDSAAEIIAEHTDATLHLTFLDAFLPPGWRQEQFADLPERTDVTAWADHYFTQDIVLDTTAQPLSHAHNVDLTRINPGLHNHKFPFYWYHATITGRYTVGRKQKGTAPRFRSEDMEYGFARSMEMGNGNWQTSRSLPPGNKPVVIRPQSFYGDGAARAAPPASCTALRPCN